MTTTERIVNAIKGILDEDRRADRERIAELERDLAGARHRAKRCEEETADANVTNSELDAVIAEQMITIDSLNRQLDEAHAENARLVLERPYPPEALRINRDLSHPQAGKLLVVRIDKYDVDNIRDKYDVSTTEDQWVGWLEDAHTAPVVDHAQEMMRRGISPELARAGAAFLDAAAPVVEEQGPHAVFDGERLPWAARK
jgi:hypothetical protein